MPAVQSPTSQSSSAPTSTGDGSDGGSSDKASADDSGGAAGTNPDGTIQPYGQCGGTGYTGSTTCQPGLTCVYFSDLFSMCM